MLKHVLGIVRYSLHASRPTVFVRLRERVGGKRFYLDTQALWYGRRGGGGSTFRLIEC